MRAAAAPPAAAWTAPNPGALPQGDSSGAAGLGRWYEKRAAATPPRPGTRKVGGLTDQKSMPPMPPMPPPGGMAESFFSGTSATMASVVMSRPATEAAS